MHLPTEDEPMTFYTHLTQADLDEVCDAYGLNSADVTVIACARQADGYHGTPCLAFDGSDAYCGVDPVTRKWDAKRLLGGHLSELAFERDCESREAHACMDTLKYEEVERG
jgi:hypothetical protein